MRATVKYMLLTYPWPSILELESPLVAWVQTTRANLFSEYSFQSFTWLRSGSRINQNRYLSEVNNDNTTIAST